MSDCIRPIPLICLLLLAISIPSPAAEDASAVLESLYGPRIKSTQATRDTADDLQLAKELLEAARAASDHPALVAELCQAAARMGSAAPAGHDDAEEALRLWADTVPASAGEAMDELVALRQKSYSAASRSDRETAGTHLIEAMEESAGLSLRSGDERQAADLYRRASAVASSIKSPRITALRAALDQAQSRLRARAQVDQLKNKLKAQSNDAASADKLVRLYVTELDEPAEARKYTFLLSDSTWGEHIALASRDPETLEANELLKLGDWYRSLAGTEKNPSAAALSRSRDYYTLFLDSDADGLTRTKAELALKDINQRIEAAGIPDSPTKRLSKNIDLLPKLVLDQHRIRGKWEADGKSLLLNSSGGAFMRSPASPLGAYELGLIFERMEGEDAIMVLLPVGQAHTMVILSGEKGRFSVIHEVREDTRANTKSVHLPGAIENKKKHTLVIRVEPEKDQAKITVTLDGKDYMSWSGPTDALSVARTWGLTDPSLAFGAHECTIRYYQARLKILSGKIRNIGS